MQFLQPDYSDPDSIIELTFYVTMPKELILFKERIALVFVSSELGYFEKIAAIMKPVW